MLEIFAYEMNDSEVYFLADHFVSEVEEIGLNLCNIRQETFSLLIEQIQKRNNQV